MKFLFLRWFTRLDTTARFEVSSGFLIGRLSSAPVPVATTYLREGGGDTNK